MNQTINHLDIIKTSKNLFYKDKQICIIQIETLNSSKFVMGGFLTLMHGRNCYFIERDKTVFFDKIFDFSSKFNKKVVCIFKTNSFNTDFLIEYCSKKLKIPLLKEYLNGSKTLKIPNKDNIVLNIEVFSHKINIPDYNIHLKDIEKTINYISYDCGYFQRTINSLVSNKPFTLKTKTKRIDIKEIWSLINSKNEKSMWKGYAKIKDKVIFDTMELYEAIKPFRKSRNIFNFSK